MKSVRRRNRKNLLVLPFVLLVVGIGVYLVVFARASDLAIESVTDVGAVGTPANVSARDGGISAQIGGKLTWVFGDTFYHPTTPPASRYL